MYVGFINNWRDEVVEVGSLLFCYRAFMYEFVGKVGVEGSIQIWYSEGSVFTAAGSEMDEGSEEFECFEGELGE